MAGPHEIVLTREPCPDAPGTEVRTVLKLNFDDWQWKRVRKRGAK